MLGVGRILNRVRPRKVTISKADKMNINPCSFFSLLRTCMAGKNGAESTFAIIAATRNSSKLYS